MLTQTRLLLYAAIGWTVAIFIGCLLPSNGLPDLTNKDKWLHFGIFALFGFLWRLTGRSTGWVIGVGIAYGYGIEVVQGLATFLHRSYDFYDALADAAGTLIGVGLALLFLKAIKWFTVGYRLKTPETANRKPQAKPTGSP